MKAVFKETRLDVRGVTDHLHNLQAFVDVSVATAPSTLESTQFRLNNAIIRTSVELQVRRISYNSPLEVVFWIGTSGATLAAATDRVLAVMIKWEEWKLKRLAAQEAKDDLALKKLKNKFMKSMYDELVEDSAEQGFPETMSKIHAANKRIRSADRFLESIETLEIED